MGLSLLFGKIQKRQRKEIKVSIVRKKLLALVLVLVLTPTVALASVASEQIEVQRNVATVTVNGEKVQTDSFIYNGTTYVPLRAVSENMGSEVTWDNKTKTAAIKSPSVESTDTDRPKDMLEIKGNTANIYWIGILAQKNSEIMDIANATAWSLTYAETTAEYDDVYKGVNQSYKALLNMKDQYYPSEIYNLYVSTYNNTIRLKVLLEQIRKENVTADSYLADQEISNCTDILDECDVIGKDLSSAQDDYYTAYMGL